MTLAEIDVWAMIVEGQIANDPIPDTHVLRFALAMGHDLHVLAHRVREIFDAVYQGIRPPAPPLD